MIQKRFYSMFPLVVISVLFRVAACFFLKEVTYGYVPGRCVRDSGTIKSSNMCGNSHFLEFSDKGCLDPEAQFGFRSDGEMFNLNRTRGCLSASDRNSTDQNLVYLDHDSINISSSVSCDDKCLSVRFTPVGTLSMIYKEENKSSSKPWCAATQGRSNSGRNGSIGLTTRCDSYYYSQRYLFGSVTCYGDKVKNANCPKDQYMIVKIASFRGLLGAKQCGLSDDFSCEVDATCKMKRHCDGLHECNITVDESLFPGDVCPGLSKYLYFEYQCVDVSSPLNKNICIDDVSLSYSSIPYKGVVQVSLNNQTKNVCWRSLKNRANYIVCNHLGYYWFHSLVNTSTPVGVRNQVFSGSISCDGSEKYLSQCSITISETEGCSHLSYIQCTDGSLVRALLDKRPLLEDTKRFPNSSFIASASSAGHGPLHAKISSGSSWCAPGSEDKHYLEVNFGQMYLIHHFITYGDSNSPKWIATYNLNYTTDSISWKTVDWTFQGNKNAYGYVSQQHPYIRARALRFIPLTYVGQACMRVEMWGDSFCESEKAGTPEAYGIFKWPDTPVQNRSKISCPYNPESFASRECLYVKEKDIRSVWGPPDVNECKYKNKRSGELDQLAQKKVNKSNVVAITEEVKNLSSVDQSDTLGAGDISNVATVLEKIVSVNHNATEISDDFFATIDNVLDASIENVLKSQRTTNSSLRILESLNNFAATIDVDTDNKFEKVNRNFAVNIHTAQPLNFKGLVFSGTLGMSRDSALMTNSTSTEPNDNIPTSSSASLSIPRTIFNELNITDSSKQTAIFILYKETKLFGESSVDSVKSTNVLNSPVIAGNIEGLSVSNLSNPIQIALKSTVRGDTNSTLCSYWDFSIGNWSQEGCGLKRILEDGRILCNCDHLTNFAILMDINPGEPTIYDEVLGIISYVGCTLSLAGLILTILVILLIREIRSKIPSLILLNFCVALSLSLVIFLAAVERSRASSLARCRAAAIALHYFLLAAILWMAVEAFNMYFAFVKVFSRQNSTKFLLKCCLFAWGLPIVIVGITMIVSLDKYGDNRYCRLHGVPFIVAFFAPAALIILGNIVAFCFIIRSLLTSGNKVTPVQKKVSRYHKARRGIGIMILLGLTWLFGILALDDAKLVFQYLFCIFNALQGFFVFLFFCVLPHGTRKHLRSFIRKKTKFVRGRSKERNKDGVENSNSPSNTPVVDTSELRLRTLSSSNPRAAKTPPTSSNGFRPESKVTANEPNLESLSSDDPKAIEKPNTSGNGSLPESEVIANEPNLENLSLGDPQVLGKSDSSSVGSRRESEDLRQPAPLLKIPDAMFLNPNLTRYSVRKSGPNYITTIEINIR